VAQNLDRLGSLYAEQKNLTEAARCHERALFIWMKALGPESTELAAKYQKLAEVYAALNRPVDAEPLVRQVLTTRENETVASLKTLASIYVARDNFTEAEPLYRLSLAILDKRGLLNSKSRIVSASEPNLDVLAETAFEYAEVLKKLKRKGEASKLEGRVKAMVGKNYVKKRQG